MVSLSEANRRWLTTWPNAARIRKPAGVVWTTGVSSLPAAERQASA